MNIEADCKRREEGRYNWRCKLWGTQNEKLGKTFQTESSLRCLLYRRVELYVSITASGLDSKGLKGLQRMFLHDWTPCLSPSVLALCNVWLTRCPVAVNFSVHYVLRNTHKHVTDVDNKWKRNDTRFTHTHVSDFSTHLTAHSDAWRG